MADSESASAHAAWLQNLSAAELRELLEGVALRVPGVGDWLDVQRASSSEDPAELLAIVDQVMTPRRRFYDYGQANEYAYDGHDTVELLAHRAIHATPGLIPVIERAITLVTRAILKSDDSSGAQGDMVHALLQAHAASVRSSAPPLTQSEQTRLVTWIVKYRYGGVQDFFDPDIVAYAPGLSTKSIEHYRRAISGIDLGPNGSYPLTRLAVLDRDRDAIIASNGGEPSNARLAARIVWDLEEAGLHDDAVAYARLGIAMDSSGWDQKLVTFVVDDAFVRDDAEAAVAARRDWFARFPNSGSFTALRDTAERAGIWSRERDAAESLLAARHAPGFASYLMGEDRIDQAWQFATGRLAPSENPTLWLLLCERRAETQPSDALPIYRDIVTGTLTVTDKRNYRSAASILKTMRTVAAAAGPDAVVEFETFLAATVDRNRRRPTCLDAFARAGLVPRR